MICDCCRIGIQHASSSSSSSGGGGGGDGPRELRTERLTIRDQETDGGQFNTLQPPA